MDRIEIITALEGDNLVINNYEEFQLLKDLAYDLSSSQGFYGRLYEDLKFYEEECDLEFPMIL